MSDSLSTTSPDTVPSEEDLRQRVLTLRIVTIGMVSGLLIFGAIALVLKGGAIAGEPDLVSWLALGLAAVSVLLHLVVPGQLAAAALNSVDPQELQQAGETERFEKVFNVFQMRHIIACALLDGAAVFNVVAYLLTQFVGNLAAAGLLLVCLLVRFPSTSGVQFWVRDRIREIEMKQGSLPSGQ